MDPIEPKLTEIFRAAFALEMSDPEIQALTRESCGSWDSMGHLNLLLAVEQVFQISIPDEKGSTVVSYWGMVELIDQLRNAQPS